MDMFAINKYKRKPVTDVAIKVYLNGRVFTEAAGHSGEAMGDKEIVQKVLSLALDSFFPPSSDMKKKYDFALEYFSRLRDNDLRTSGKHYENTPEKLEAIKEKYRNGVSREMIEEWIMGL